MAVSGIDVKMAVTGISQFKNNISQAKQNMKTLDAQLTLTEKQFKATGDAETYMQQKSEQLKAKLAEQKTVAENAEKALRQMTEQGVDKGSKAFQDMIRTLASAKGDMIDTKAALDNIAGAADDADIAVDGLSSDLSQIGKNISVSNVTEALGTITDGMEAVMAKAIDIGRRIISATLGAGSWADELNTTAKQWGITPEELQRMQMTADIIDTEASTILQAKQKLNKVIGQDLLTEGSGVAEMLETLGLSNVISTDPEERFWQIGEAIMNMGDESIQEAAATKLMGKSWRELIPLFEAGREEYEKVKDSWNVVSKDQIESLQKMDDEYHKLENEFEVVKKQFEATFAEAITPVMETLTGLMQEFNKYLESPEGQAALEALGSAVSSLFDDLTKVTPEDVINSITGVIDGIKGGLQWIADNKGAVVGAVEAFIGAWAVMKTAQGVTTALQLINGIRGLTGAGAAGAAGSAASAASAGTAAGSSFGSAFTSAFISAAPVLAGLLGLTAAGVAGAKMIEANLNDENLNQVYGDNSGSGGLIDNLTPDMIDAIQKYWNVYENTGSEEAYEARDRLQQLLQESGYVNDEQGVGLIEQIFDNMLNEVDPDGMAEKLAAAMARAEQLAGESGGVKNSAVYGNNKKLEKLLEETPGAMGKAVETTLNGMGVYMNGEKVGTIITPYVSDNLATGFFGMEP